MHCKACTPAAASTHLLLIMACHLLDCTCPMFCRAVYEMTAMVCHVMDTDASGAGEEKPEGHLVAHVKVGQVAAVLLQEEEECPKHLASSTSPTCAGEVMRIPKSADRPGADSGHPAQP